MRLTLLAGNDGQPGCVYAAFAEDPKPVPDFGFTQIYLGVFSPDGEAMDAANQGRLKEAEDILNGKD